MPYHIRTMVCDDLEPAVSVLERAFGRPDIWAEELDLYLHVESEGAQVALEDGIIVGVGGSIDFGPFAWIGVMGVELERQGRGIARAILDSLLATLNERRCPIAVLDASAAGESLYVRAGFRDHGSTVLYERDTLAPTRPPLDTRLTAVQTSDLPDLFAFDRPIFGADRSRVLGRLFRTSGNCAYIVRAPGGRVIGYLFVQPGRIGPWVGESPEAAEALLTTALANLSDSRTTVRIPVDNTAGAQFLRHHGFAPRRSLRHMYLGSHPPEQDRCRIYSQASFAFG